MTNEMVPPLIRLWRDFLEGVFGIPHPNAQAKEEVKIDPPPAQPKTRLNEDVLKGKSWRDIDDLMDQLESLREELEEHREHLRPLEEFCEDNYETDSSLMEIKVGKDYIFIQTGLLVKAAKAQLAIEQEGFNDVKAQAQETAAQTSKAA